MVKSNVLKRVEKLRRSRVCGKQKRVVKVKPLLVRQNVTVLFFYEPSCFFFPIILGTKKVLSERVSVVGRTFGAQLI